MKASNLMISKRMASIRTATQLLFLSAAICTGPAALAQMKPGITAEQKAAAMQEGRVHYYTSRATLTANAIGKAASKALGIKVVITRISSSTNYNRTVQEFETGVNNADVIDTSVVAHFYSMKEKGMLTPYTPANVGLYRSKDYYDPDHYWHASQIGLGAIQYNSNLVKGNMIPRTWKELTDPKYKGKLVQGHIKASGTSAIVDYHLVELYGWEYFRKLKENEIMTQQSCDSTNIMAVGERLVGLCDHQITAPAQKRGMPIETVFPEDGVFGQLGPVAHLAKAPHPNAAKLLIDWITSPEGQQYYVDGGVLSAIESPKIKYPPQYPNPKKMKVLLADPAKVAEWLKEGREKFTEIFGG
jgi:iron(III) transport system substrate-binding protein